MINIFGWTIARVYKIEEYDKIKQQAVESGANEFGMRLKNEELEEELNRVKVWWQMAIDKEGAYQTKITDLETDCNDYKEGQGRYEDYITELREEVKHIRKICGEYEEELNNNQNRDANTIDNLRAKIEKLNKKIMKMKERR